MRRRSSGKGVLGSAGLEMYSGSSSTLSSAGQALASLSDPRRSSAFASSRNPSLGAASAVGLEHQHGGEEAMLYQRLDMQEKELKRRGSLVSSLQRNVQNLTQLCRKDKENIERLKEECAAHKKTQKDLEEFAELRKMHKKLQEDKAALEVELKRSVDELESHKASQGTIGALQSQTQSLTKQLEKERQDMGFLRSRCKHLMSEKEALSCSVKELKRRSRDAEARLQGLGNSAEQFKKLTAEHAAKLEEFDELSKRLEKAEAEASSYRFSQQNVEKDLRRRIAEMQEQLSQAELAAKQNALARNGAAEELERRCRELEGRDKLVNENLGAMQALEDMVKSLRYENEAAEARALEAIAARQSAGEQVASLRKAHDEEVSKLRAALKAEQKGVVMLEAEAERLRRKNDEIEVSLSDLRDGNAAVTELEGELSALRKEVETEKRGREQDRKSAAEKLASLGEEIAERDGRLAVLEDRLVESSRSSSTIAQEVARMREEVGLLKRTNETLTDDLRAVKESEKQARADLADSVEELERYASKSRREELLQAERLNEQVQTAEKEVQALRVQLEEARQEAVEAKKLNAVIEKLRKELATRPVPRVLSNAEVKELIAKLQQTESAAESAFTCLVCMEMFQSPVTCIPCGHSFCKKCIENKVQEEGRTHCPACTERAETDEKKGGTVDYFIENQLLQNLAAKHAFRKTLLGSLDSIDLSS